MLVTAYDEGRCSILGIKANSQVSLLLIFREYL